MSPPFTPARSSTPPRALVQRSAVSDVSRSSALSTTELATLTPDEIEFLDTVISRAPTSATTFIHIFKAYNQVISERGLDAENEVDYYKKLLKIGTLKGENWASKWRAVKAQNGYTVTSMPAKTRPPLHKATALVPPSHSSTTRLLQRLKALQHEQCSEPSEISPADNLSRTDISDTETDSPLLAAPVPTLGRPLSRLTTTSNTLGLDVGALNTAPCRSLANLRTPNSRAPDEGDAWNKIRVEQDEQSANQFCNMRLLQRCFDVWKQSHDWVIVRLLLNLWGRTAQPC